MRLPVGCWGKKGLNIIFWDFFVLLFLIIWTSLAVRSEVE